MKAEGGRQKAKGRGRLLNDRSLCRLLCVTLLLFFILHPSSFILAGAWSRQPSGTLAWLHGVYFLDGQKGWAVGGRGALLKTEDGGRRWQLRPRPTEDSLRDVYFANEQTGWLVCERSIYELRTEQDQRSYLMRTNDGGETWQRVDVLGNNVEVLLWRVAFADEEHGWALGEGGALYATRDGGVSWARQEVPTPHLLLGATFLNNSRGWIAGAGATLLATDDGGETWRAAPRPSGLNANGRLNAICFIDGRRGWVVGSGGVVIHTTNGGRTWQAQATPTDADLYDVKFLNEREGWAVGAEGTLLHTVDGGARWQAESFPTRHPLERLALAAPAHVWAVGFGGIILAQVSAATPPPLQPDQPATRKRRVAN